MVTLDNVILLMGYNARAQCYAQALRASRIAPASVITFGDPARDQARDAQGPALSGGGFMFTPDLNETLAETIKSAGWSWTASKADNVNDPGVIELVQACNPEIAVYAGYGGQIIGSNLLATIPAFLHMHCGLLPEYRGSTTAYYSWLKDNACGVSAILMNAEIDEGPVLVRRRFPPPPADADVDQFYDNALRAHVLIDCMTAVCETGSLPAPQPQPAGGDTYYVIHPVLKHIALMQPRAEI